MEVVQVGIGESMSGGGKYGRVGYTTQKMVESMQHRMAAHDGGVPDVGYLVVWYKFLLTD